MRLNGWHRLLVVVAVLWGMVVAAVAWQDFPARPDWFTSNAPWTFEVKAPNGQTIRMTADGNGLPTRRELDEIFHKTATTNIPTDSPQTVDYAALAAQARGATNVVTIAGNPSRSFVEVPAGERAPETEEPLAVDVIRVRTPAGSLDVPVGTGDQEVQRTYEAKAAGDLWLRRTSYVSWAVISWLVPMLVLCGSGWAVGWITQGFKDGNR